MKNDTLLDGIVRFISQAMPELNTVERYAGQFKEGTEKRVSFKCPAVFIASLGKRYDQTYQRDFGQVAVNARLVFFCIAGEGRRDKRTVTAEDMADHIVVLGHGSNWDVDGAEEAVFERAENAFSDAFDKQGLGMWVVEFTQRYRLGESTWPPGEQVELEAFLHAAPEIGEVSPEYQGDYDSMGKGQVRIELGESNES